jgi:hypothetical protein
MLKLSKAHIVKTAEEEVKEEKEEHDQELNGAEVADDDDANDEPEDKEEEPEKAQKIDARREAATPHAHAAKNLFSKRRELMNQVNMLDDELSKHRDVLRALDPKMKHEAYADDKELRTYLKPEKMEEKKKKKKKLDKAAEVAVVDGLLKVAEVLDYAGDVEGVTLLEDMLRVFAKQDEVPQYGVKNVEKVDRKYPEIAPIPPTMSTRHCPDHNGAQMARVGNASFQCNLDGRIYNWDTGFKDMNGNVYPPAQISSVDFPETGERQFENRQQATSKNVK